MTLMNPVKGPYYGGGSSTDLKFPVSSKKPGRPVGKTRPKAVKSNF